jgi:hypothetical protein
MRIRRHQVLLSLGLIFLFQIGLAIHVDRGPVQLRDPEYQLLEDRWRACFENDPDRKRIMALGSSRTAYGLAAKQLTQTQEDVWFNFGIPGAGPLMQYLVLQRLADQGLMPDLLLIEVLPAFYHAGCIQREAGMMDGARLNWNELAEVQRRTEGAWQPFAKWFMARALPTERHHAELRTHLGFDGISKSQDFRIDSHGWQPRIDPALHTQREALTEMAHRQYDSTYANYQPLLRSFRLLLDMARLAHSHGTRIILVVPPESSSFRAQYPIEWEKTMAVVAALPLLPVIDARGWVPDEHFYDGHHLLPMGAAIFTNRLPLVPPLPGWHDWPRMEDCSSLDQIPEAIRSQAP